MPVNKVFYEEYLGVCLWLYKSSEFEVLQILYPDKQGVWPWSDDASLEFRAWQPFLNGR